MYAHIQGIVGRRMFLKISLVCIQKSAQLSFGDDKSILWNVLKKKHMVLRVIITEKDWQEKNGWLAVLNQAIIGVIF